MGWGRSSKRAVPSTSDRPQYAQWVAAGLFGCPAEHRSVGTSTASGSGTGSSSEVVATGSGSRTVGTGARKRGTETNPPLGSATVVSARVAAAAGSGARTGSTVSTVGARHRRRLAGKSIALRESQTATGHDPVVEVEPHIARRFGRADRHRDEPVEPLVDEEVDPRVGVGAGVTTHLPAARHGHFDLTAQHDLDTLSRRREDAERRARGHALAEQRVELVDEDRARLVDASAPERAAGREQLVDRGATSARQREERDLAEAADEALDRARP